MGQKEIERMRRDLRDALEKEEEIIIERADDGDTAENAEQSGGDTIKTPGKRRRKRQRDGGSDSGPDNQ